MKRGESETRDDEHMSVAEQSQCQHTQQEYVTTPVAAPVASAPVRGWPTSTWPTRASRATSAASAPENYFDPSLDFDRLFRTSKRFTQKPLPPVDKKDVSSIFGSKLPGVPIADLDGAFLSVDEQKARNTELKRELLLRQTRYGVSQAEYRKRQEILKYRKELNTMLGGDIAEEVGMGSCGNATPPDGMRLGEHASSPSSIFRSSQGRVPF